MACTTTIFISTIPSITFPTRVIPGSMSRLPVATFTLPPAPVRGKTARPRTASRKFFPAKESATRWTTGVRRAATTGRIGRTRCASTFRIFSNCCDWTVLGGRGLMQAQMLELVAALFDDLVVINPDVAVAGEHVDVGPGFPVGVSLTAIRITEGEMHSRKFFILKQNPDHLG